MKSQIISLDLIAALPIASMGILLLLISASASQSYLLGVADYQNRSMGLSSASQEIAAVIDSPGTNLSVAVSVSNSIASERGFASSIEALGNLYRCGSPIAVCRFVTFSGSTYLLVVSDESPS
jgi:hypothetical protein